MSRKATQQEAKNTKENFTRSTMFIKVNSADDHGETSIQQYLSSQGGRW